MSFTAFIRNNWKKLTFASATLGYGLYSLKSHYDISQHMRILCKEVANFADNGNGALPKHVLVIMNPVANKKKAEKKFKNYCEPVLHLAGYSIEIFKTNYVGHAKTFVENIKILPDAIVVAGGDGTSSEVVTGLLRRDESPCPIIILPLGFKNETALKYLNLEPKNDLDYVKSLSNTILPMIQEKFRYENVLKFDVIEDVENNSQANLKPIYGLNQFSWGLLRDIESVKDKYWYFGNLRHYAAALFNSFSNDLNWNFSTDYVYTPPCPGCRNCTVETGKNLHKSYLRKLIPHKMNEGAVFKHYIENDNCNTQIQGTTETNQLNISCNRNKNDFYELETKFIKTLYPGWNFIKNLSNITHNDIEPSLVLKSRTIKLIPASSVENKSFYSIDGEEYDARPIKVSIIPNAIKMFLL